MKKSKEELNALKKECEAMSLKLRELSDEELDLVTGGGVGEALTGKLPGVQIMTASAKPILPIYGKIRVRGGVSTTQSNDPLYIVDGFDVDNIQDVEPDDIERMDILKDATAGSIY